MAQELWTLNKVQKLAQELQDKPRAKANNVVHLIAALTDSRNEAVIRASIHGLKLYFINVSQDGDLAAGSNKRARVDASSDAPEAQDPTAVLRAWLWRQYSAYLNALMATLTTATASASIQVAATAAVMEAVRCERGVGVFSGPLYCRLLTTIATSGHVKPEVYTLLFTRYFSHADVRFYSLAAVKVLAARYADVSSSAGAAPAAAGGTAEEEGLAEAAAAVGEAAAADSAAAGKAGLIAISPEDLCRNLFDVLAAVPDSLPTAGKGEDAAASLSSWCGAEEAGPLSAPGDKNESCRARRKRKAQEQEEQQGGAAARSGQRAVWANVKTQKRLFSEAWLALLTLPVPPDIYRKVLLRLHSSVIPNMSHPTSLADFLTYSINQGGLTGMLALNSLFLLVTRHGLEYPRFYARLYTLLTRAALAARYRPQFFKLADIFLASGLVPAYTVAAFAKRFARLALTASPAGAMLCIAFVHNLIRRHPACMTLLHKPLKEGEAPADAGSDPYLEDAEDPADSRAVESSLWELNSLRSHYCPQVSALVAVLDRDLGDRTKTTEVDVEPLLSQSYTSLFNAETARRIKAVPVAFYKQAPTRLFDANCTDDLAGWAMPEAAAPAVADGAAA